MKGNDPADQFSLHQESLVVEARRRGKLGSRVLPQWVEEDIIDHTTDLKETKLLNLLVLF